MEFRGKVLTIQAEEPPILTVLSTICHNELCREDGLEKCDYVTIGTVQRWLSRFFDWDVQSLRLVGPRQP